MLLNFTNSGLSHAIGTPEMQFVFVPYKRATKSSNNMILMENGRLARGYNVYVDKVIASLCLVESFVVPLQYLFAHSGSRLYMLHRLGDALRTTRETAPPLSLAFPRPNFRAEQSFYLTPPGVGNREFIEA